MTEEEEGMFKNAGEGGGVGEKCTVKK